MKTRKCYIIQKGKGDVFLAKKDNKSHHDKGIKHNFNRQENANSFIQRRDPRLNQQQIAEQNLAQNKEEGNENYKQLETQLQESAREYKEKGSPEI